MEIVKYREDLVVRLIGLSMYNKNNVSFFINACIEAGTVYNGKLREQLNPMTGCAGLKKRTAAGRRKCCCTI